MIKILLTLCLFFVAGCSSMDVSVYKDEKPELILENYLNGSFDAYGIFTDRKGQVKKRFHVLIEAKWQGSVGTLDESFTYSDGTTSKRIWTVKKLAADTYEGTASDVIGVAAGKVAGNALQWKYTLALEVDGSTYHVQFDDWMYLMDNKVMLNKSKMTKFGIYLGEVTLTFVKRDR